jgi:hypothetical protein
LHLTFKGLQPQSTTSSACQDNRASSAVFHKLDHDDDGLERHMVRGQLVAPRRLRPDRPA